MPVGDVVYFEGKPHFVIAEIEGTVMASPLHTPIAFQDSSDPMYDGYPHSTGNLTDENGDPITPAAKTTSKAPTVTGAKS